MLRFSECEAIFKAFSRLLSLVLLLLNAIKSSEAALFDGCDHTYSINAGYSYLESPYYPNNYPASTSCRYKFVAPLDYDIQVNCTINLNKGANACSTEFFYVASDGDTQLRGSEQFCGQGIIVRKSLFRQLVLAYASYGSWGKFRCQLYAAPQACDCGWSVSTRIVNGQEAGLNEYPSMVALRDTATNLASYCGGTIISHNRILTAAHCAEQQPNAAYVRAYVGDHDLSSSSETKYATSYGISQIIKHPSYTADPVNNDLAIFVVNGIIEWSRGVAPICLPTLTATFDYYRVWGLGWGSTSFGGPTSARLQAAEFMVMTNSQCAQSYQGVAPISSSQICTYDFTGNYRDSCQYDSGGPIIYRSSRMFLLGIISFGKPCGQENYASGVNTRITSYLTWINQNIGYAACQKSM